MNLSDGLSDWGLDKELVGVLWKKENLHTFEAREQKMNER
jgi:hypothetical protein